MNLSIKESSLNIFRFYILIAFAVHSITISAKTTHNDDADLSKTPPHIIRACCTFGYDLKLWGLPYITIDQVISIDELGDHHYLGKKKEGVGTIYTNRGGVIDIGHLRDQIDWTRYLYNKIRSCRGENSVLIPLGNDGGPKNLYINVPAQLDSSDCILLAGKITFDLSLWHEISTWYGVSSIPMVPEKFSSFSVEDVYSNLLGIHIGMKTLHSKLPFNQASTKFILSTLDSLDAVKTAKETYDAYDVVNNIWYTNKKRLPRTKVTIKRDTDVLTSCRPWIIPTATNNIGDPIILDVPLYNTKGELLTNFYQLTINLNNKFPVEDLFPNCENRINQDDFGVMLNRIAKEIEILEQIEYSENK